MRFARFRMTKWDDAISRDFGVIEFSDAEHAQALAAMMVKVERYREALEAILKEMPIKLTLPLTKAIKQIAEEALKDQ